VSGDIWYPTRDTGSNPMPGMYHVKYTDVNSILLDFQSSNPPSSGQYRVIVNK